jgi:hypothetical protein
VRKFRLRFAVLRSSSIVLDKSPREPIEDVVGLGEDFCIIDPRISNMELMPTEPELFGLRIDGSAIASSEFMLSTIARRTSTLFCFETFLFLLIVSFADVEMPRKLENMS